MQSRLHVSEFSLLPVYVWVDSADEGAGWKLAELRILADKEDGTEWTSSLAEATSDSSHTESRKPAPAPAIQQEEEQEEEDDDDYWASYDRTPGAATPAAKRSPAPRAPHQPPTTAKPASTSRSHSRGTPILCPLRKRGPTGPRLPRPRRGKRRSNLDLDPPGRRVVQGRKPYPKRPLRPHAALYTHATAPCPRRARCTEGY